MIRKPEGEPDDPSLRPPRRWPALRVGWIGRVRSGSGASGGLRLLFLDDDPNRAELFLKDHPQAVWVTTVPQCLARLAEPWDEVHLDHDLGGKTFVDSSETDCGMEVIRWLCKEPRLHLKCTRFFVHTHNAAAGLLMVLLMRGGGYKAEFRPFGLDLERLLAQNEEGPEAEAGSSPVIGRTGTLRSLGRVVAAGLAALASWWVRLRPALERAELSPSAAGEAGGGPSSSLSPGAGGAESSPRPGEASPPARPIEPQGALPEAAPAIQPPPRTRSS